MLVLLRVVVVVVVVVMVVIEGDGGGVLSVLVGRVLHGFGCCGGCCCEGGFGGNIVTRLGSLSVS